MIWQDWNGRGGVQFVDVPKTSRRLLTEYLGANRSSDVREELPDVTVDVEDPMIVTSGSAAIEHGFQAQGPQGQRSQEVAVAEPVAIVEAPDPNNRRRRNAMPAAWAQKCIGRERRSRRIAV